MQLQRIVDPIAVRNAVCAVRAVPDRFVRSEVRALNALPRDYNHGGSIVFGKAVVGRIRADRRFADPHFRIDARTCEHIPLEVRIRDVRARKVPVPHLRIDRKPRDLKARFDVKRLIEVVHGRAADLAAEAWIDARNAEQRDVMLVLRQRQGSVIFQQDGSFLLNFDVQGFLDRKQLLKRIVFGFVMLRFTVARDHLVRRGAQKDIDLGNKVVQNHRRDQNECENDTEHACDAAP